MSHPLLEVRGLKTVFATDDGVVGAVDGIDLRIDAGETLALVGESGCGKSVTALSIMRLLPQPPARVTAGEVLWNGRDLLRLSPRAIRGIRGQEISMILQDPMTNLNPVFSVGEQIAESLRLHKGVGRRQARDDTIAMLSRVGIPSPERRAGEYPHQLSGGMRQRVMIAMALSCSPKLLIADEPTTALDVTIQAQILDLMRALKQEFKMATLLITHNLGIVAETAQRVMVMYAGRIVEEGDVLSLYEAALHPYTRGLLNSVPRVDRPARGKGKFGTIPGSVPGPRELPQGCKFFPRCTVAVSPCANKEPPLFEKPAGRRVRCWLAEAN
jgi:oligopeptide/dipeptide ABC transporter ATP-binding protein